MKSIQNHLLALRRAVILQDLKILGWRLYSFLLLVFLIMIPLESIFYFSGFFRFTFFIFLLTFCFLFLGWLVLTGIQIRRNRVDQYRWSSLARMAGQRAFSKEDTLLNALQLERDQSYKTSSELSESFVQQASGTLSKIELGVLVSQEKTVQWKRVTLILLIASTLMVGTTWRHAVSSLYRWSHPKTEFLPPIPFTLTSTSGHLHLLGGETAAIAFLATGSTPDSITLELRSLAIPAGMDSVKQIVLHRSLSTNKYSYNFENVFYDFNYHAFVSSSKFWEPWESIRSPHYSISVTDRPVMENFTVTITSPEYSRLPVQTQKANRADIQGLKGSRIDLSLRSNRRLKKATLRFEKNPHNMDIRGKRASTQFVLNKDDQFSIQLKDKRGISNRNPIPYRLEVIPDLDPTLSVIQPPPIVELGSGQTIPIQLTIEDDFGFSKLQLAYEIQRPSYIQAEPFISIFNVPIPDNTQTKQDIKMVWSLQDLELMPEDEVHYHFELYDNDTVSGPKKSLSGTFIARLPSLNDLFQAFEDKETEIAEEAEIKLEDIRQIKEQMEKAELELLKIDKPDWDQQKAIHQMLKNVKEELEQFQNLSEQLEALGHTGDKHELFSEHLLEKFNELQDLIQNIFPPEFLNNIDLMEKALENLNKEDMLKALQNLANNMDQVEQELDRFLDIFKRVQAEQKIDELHKRLEQLVHQQDKLDGEIRRTDHETDPSIYNRLEQEEALTRAEFNEILQDIENAVRTIKSYSKSTAEALEDLSQSDIAKNTNISLDQTQYALNRKESFKAMDASLSALESLQNMGDSMDLIRENFQRETTKGMAQKFREILRDVLSLSKRQESLIQKTKSTPRHSPRQSELAVDQQLLQDQLRGSMQNMMNLSKETFMVSPEMGRGMGMAFAQMEDSKTKLGDRNGAGSLSHQSKAMAALNEGAKAILNSINEMQSSGSASGYEAFLKRMEDMAGQQKGINDQGMQLALGQMASGLYEALMGEMLKNQKSVRKSLSELMNEMQSSGKEGLGDMAGIANEMDEVIKELEVRQFTQKTQNRQQRILTRMLNSQKSLTKRGFEDTRKSKTATSIVYRGPSGLPQDLGQRQSLVSAALNEAMKSGYSRDYQTMIRRYFNALHDAEELISPDSLPVSETEGQTP